MDQARGDSAGTARPMAAWAIVPVQRSINKTEPWGSWIRSLVEVPQLLVHPVDREPFRVKLPAIPLVQFPMARMARVGHCFEEVGISPDPTDILGRAGPLPGDAPGVTDVRLRLQGSLQDDLVLPGVAEVVV